MTPDPATARPAHEPNDRAHGHALWRIMGGVLLPFALAHCVSYLYRNVNTVIYPDLVRDVGLDANGLGLLTGVYMATFALAQLPVGMALDRWGPRRVQLPMLCLSALGGLLFAMADTFTGLLLARGLIGLGVSASLMAALKASSLWVPAERQPLSASLLMAVGSLGAMASTAPMQFAVDLVGWRWGFAGIACCALAVAVLIGTVVPEHPNRLPAVNTRQLASSVRDIFVSPLFWRTALCTALANGAYMAIQGLWLGPWLRDVGQLNRADAAQVLFWGTVGMVAGTVTWGAVADRLRRHRIRPAMVCGSGMSAFLVCQALMLGPQTTTSAALLAVAFTFFGTACSLNYAIIAQTLPSHLSGRVSTSFNLLIFAAAFLFQWGLGAVISLWPADPTTGAYPLAAYQMAWLACLALQLPGWLLWLGMRPWRLAPAPH